MNGKAATLAARLLPAIRQRHLTNTLGQVTCSEAHDYYVALYRPCDKCGAAI